MLRRLLLGQRKRDENEEKNKIVSTTQKDDEKKSESEDEGESESEESESESMEDSSTCSLDESFGEYDKVEDWEGFKMAEGHDVTKRELPTLINGGNIKDVKGMSRARSSMEQREDVGTMRIQNETKGNAVAGSEVCEEHCDDDSKKDLNKESEIDKEKILSGAHSGQDNKEYERPSLNALNNDENEPGDNGDNNKNDENNSSNMNNSSSSSSSSSNNNSSSSSNNNNNSSSNNNNNDSSSSNSNSRNSSSSNASRNNSNVNSNNSNNHNSKLEKFTKAPNENTQTTKSNPNEQNAKENLTTKSTANTKPPPYVTPISTNRKTSPGISRHYSFSSTEKHPTPGGVNNHRKTYQQKTPGGSRNTPGKGARILRTQSINYGGNDETKQDRQARNDGDRVGTGGIARDKLGTGGIRRDKVGTEGIARDKEGTGGIIRDKVETGGIKDTSLIKSNQARDVYRNTAGFKRGQRDTKKTMVTTKTSKTTNDFQKNISISALEESLGLNISELREIIKKVKIEQRQKANQCDDKNGTIVEGRNPVTQGTLGNRGENNGSTEDRVSQDLGNISKDVEKSKELDDGINVVDGHLVEPRRSPDGCHSDGKKIEGRVEGSKDEISSDSGVSETDANSTERQRYISIKAILKRKEYLKKEIENLDARVVVMAEHKKDVQFVHDLFDLYSDGLKAVERNNVGVPCVPSLKGIMDCQLREMTDGEFARKMKELENLGVPYFTEIQDHVEKLREKIHQSLEDDRKCRSKGVQKLRFEMGKVLGMCEGLLDCVYHE